MASEFAISLHAPWAWALMHAGKDVENRSKNFPRRRDGEMVTGRVWVHASKGPGDKPTFNGAARSMLETLWNSWGSAGLKDTTALFAATCLEHGDHAPTLEYLNGFRGHIVGSIEVTGYRDPSDPPDSPWYIPGSLAVMVRNPKPLTKPVPAKGALGWWRPSEETRLLLEGGAP